MMHARCWARVCLLAVPAFLPPAVRGQEAAPPSSTRGVTQVAVDTEAVAVARRVTALADAYLATWLAAFPERGTTFGIPGARHDRLSDRSGAAERAWRAHEDQWLAALRAFDPTRLVGRPEGVTYGVLREELEASTAMRSCGERLWTVRPLFGALSNSATLAQLQPVGTEDLRTQALTRWRAFPRFLDTEIANLREGVASGYTEPKVNVRRVIESADRLLATEPSASPFYSPAARDSTPAFRQAFGRLVAEDITPAVRRYRDYLVTEYLPAAREAIAITANPDGAACYRAAIRRYTTLDMSPGEVHRAGLALVAAAESTMRAISVARYGTTDLREAMRQVIADSSATFHSRDAVIPALETIIARANAAMPRVVGKLPNAVLVVEPHPAFQEATAPGQYLPAAVDGSRGGVFRVNLRNATMPGERLRMEGLTFHEGIPGHHLQVSIALERTGVHPLTRYLFNSAFSEGWATYAEHVADELGLFSSDAQRLRWLEDNVFGGATLVIETGMHAQGWTRQQAIDYELAHTTRSPEQVAVDVDRRIGWPGQGLSYRVGALEIRRLREQAERGLGPRFDIRAFHDRVLEDGSVPLPMLREKITRWLAQARPTQ